MLDLSIILVNFNGKDYLKTCLKSLLIAAKSLDLEILVVDNASSDGSVEMVKKEFPQVSLITSAKNIGFGAGNNLALKKATGRYQLLLNTDTEIKDPQLFSKMIEWMDKHPKAGVSSCALINPDGSFQSTGGYFPTLARVFAWMFFLDDIPVLNQIITSYHPRGLFYNKERNIDWLTGAFYLIRREALKEAGIFDEDYFMYVEEVDLSYRIKQRGWEICLLPQFKITHYGQVFSGNEFATTQEFKGLKIFYKKHFPLCQLFVLRLFLKAGALLRIIVLGLLKGGDTAKIYVKAFQIA